MVGAQRWFEDFKVGDRFESPSKTLTDAHFLFFAGMLTLGLLPNEFKLTRDQIYEAQRRARDWRPTLAR